MLNKSLGNDVSLENNKYGNLWPGRATIIFSQIICTKMLLLVHLKINFQCIVHALFKPIVCLVIGLQKFGIMVSGSVWKTRAKLEFQ